MAAKRSEAKGAPKMTTTKKPKPKKRKWPGFLLIDLKHLDDSSVYSTARVAARVRSQHSYSGFELVKVTITED